MEYSKFKNAPQPSISRDQLLTVGHMEDFKKEILFEVSRLLKEIVSPTTKKWLRSAEARKRLGISAGTLGNLRVNGSLPFTKVGGMIFYDVEAIEKRLSKNAK